MRFASRPTVFRIALFAACVFAACHRPVVAPQAEVTEPYKPAVSDYGVVHRVWVHPPIGELKPSRGFKLVAAEITFPPAQQKFDLDDVDIFDADTGENFGSGDPAYRVTQDGRFVPAHLVNDDGPYRGVFFWIVPASVRHVNFGTWGTMLFTRPAVVQRKGPRLPQ